jgi:hypothetical protein
MRKSCKDDFPKTHRPAFRGWYHTLRYGNHHGSYHLGHGHPVDVLCCGICPAFENEVPFQHRLVGLLVSSWYVQSICNHTRNQHADMRFSRWRSFSNYHAGRGAGICILPCGCRSPHCHHCSCLGHLFCQNRQRCLLGRAISQARRLRTSSGFRSKGKAAHRPMLQVKEYKVLIMDRTDALRRIGRKQTKAIDNRPRATPRTRTDLLTFLCDLATVAARLYVMLRMRSRPAIADERNARDLASSQSVSSARTTTGVDDGPIYPSSLSATAI